MHQRERELHSISVLHDVYLPCAYDDASELFLSVVLDIQNTIRICHWCECGEGFLRLMVHHQRNVRCGCDTDYPDVYSVLLCLCGEAELEDREIVHKEIENPHRVMNVPCGDNNLYLARLVSEFLCGGKIIKELG